MQTWQSSFLGIPAVPRELSAFELNAFFTFDAVERRAIDGVPFFSVQKVMVGERALKIEGRLSGDPGEKKCT